MAGYVAFVWFALAVGMYIMTDPKVGLMRKVRK